MTEPDHDVPARPAFVLRVRADSTGTETGWLDDEPVTPPPGVGIHRALIRAARERADRTDPGSTIRVAGVTPDGAVFHLGIGPDGKAWEVPPPPDDDPDDETGAVPDEISHFDPSAHRNRAVATLPLNQEFATLLAFGERRVML